MNLADCYQILGLKLGAPLEDVKSAYRRLARQYHPDVNADAQSQEKFIAISNAYQTLVQISQRTERSSSPASSSTPPNGTSVKTQTSHASRAKSPSTPSTPPTNTSPPPSPPQAPVERPSVKVKVQVRQAPTPTPVAPLSEEDVKIKQSGFQQLQDLLKQKRCLRAVTLAEGLAQRLPQDLEVKQWQAIAYQQLGRQLIGQKQLDKARIYLKKALKTDPHNRSLWAEVENDFRHLEKQYK